MGNPEAEKILQRTRQTLQAVEAGLEDLAGDNPARSIAGLQSVAVFGRAVTNVLQNLRSAVGADVFDAWYEPWQVEMERDKLLRFFYKMRSSYLKEGQPGTPWSPLQMELPGGLLARLLVKWQPGASLEFDDNTGEVAWLVPREDGSEERVVVFTSESQVKFGRQAVFAQPPRRHLGKKLEEKSAVVLATYYVNYLRRLVAAAHDRFAGDPRLFQPPELPPA